MDFFKFLGIIICILIQNIPNDDAFSTDYCDRQLCKRYKYGEWIYAHNIGCDSTNTYSSSCPYSAELQNITWDLQDLILTLHNENRNQTAGGNLGDFAEANRMTTMQWDDELAYLAELNCYRCYYGADQCRNTANFPHVGQNIDIYRSSSGYLDNNQTINRIFNLWFNEYNVTDPNIVKRYYHDGSNVGHFTQIISGKSAYIGCALINWKGYDDSGNREHYQYFVCNYSFTNFDGYPVYTIGDTASACQTGNNPNYTALCSTDEYVAPVP